MIEIKLEQLSACEGAINKSRQLTKLGENILDHVGLIGVNILLFIYKGLIQLK